MHFLYFLFLKLSKLEMFVQKQDFYIWIKGKPLATSNNPNRESHKKIVRKQEGAWLRPGNFT